MAGDWFDGGGTGVAVDTHALLEDKAVIKAIASMVDAGALVSLGTTSDGGALALTVTVDGRWRREYFRDLDGLMAWLAEAAPAVSDVAHRARGSDGRQTASAARGSRSRRS